jgi:hypothetical protein
LFGQGRVLEHSSIGRNRCRYCEEPQRGDEAIQNLEPRLLDRFAPLAMTILCGDCNARGACPKPVVAAPGFEPGSRPDLGLAGYKPAALPLSYAAELVRVRCSAHRPRRSKRRTLLARASPCYLARTAGVEPAYLPVRSRVLIRLSYVRVLEPPAGSDPAPPG